MTIAEKVISHSFWTMLFTNSEVKDYKLYSWDESNRMSDHLPIYVEV